MQENKPKMAVHKFTSCDGCQLAFLNLGEELIELSEMVEIVHFAELGVVDPNAVVDIAFVEGSVSTPDEIERIKKIREQSTFVISIGACATAGGIQALRNRANVKQWVADIYAKPEYIKTLQESHAIAYYIPVDLELQGCPVNGKQCLDAVRSLLLQVKPAVHEESVCMECKRAGNICVLVTDDMPCMGPVTQTGCGALCPAMSRDCYACYGPKENANTASLKQRFAKIGLSTEQIRRRFLFIHQYDEKETIDGKKNN